MPQATHTGFALESPAFAPGAPIPVRHTADGEDLSPELTWSALPPGTRELALIMDDPDAPREEPWVHWVIYGIAGDARGLPEGIAADENPQNLPGAAQGRNTWGTVGYRGPAPPKGHGTHHYHSSLFALARPLSLQPGLDKEALLKALQGNILARAELIGTYQR